MKRVTLKVMPHAAKRLAERFNHSVSAYDIVALLVSPYDLQVDVIKKKQLMIAKTVIAGRVTPVIIDLETSNLVTVFPDCADGQSERILNNTEYRKNDRRRIGMIHPQFRELVE